MADGVVLDVALGALRLPGGRRQRHRGAVALEAGSLGMLRVHEVDAARPRRMAGYGDGHRRGGWSRVFVALVAGLAPGFAGRLVVADLATAGPFERQAPFARSGLVAYEARDLRVACVRKAVGGGWRWKSGARARRMQRGHGGWRPVLAAG